MVDKGLIEPDYSGPLELDVVLVIKYIVKLIILDNSYQLGDFIKYNYFINLYVIVYNN